jgi:murein DD-endopeptidase MepM/ murein hydrolase activator NlpD
VRFRECSIRKKPTGAPSRHTGVDLAPGDQNTEIKSLTYGIVWACGTHNEYGNVMIIKSTLDPVPKLYLLAHLEDFRKDAGQYIEPGETVAITGTTGTSTGIHLHVEVFMCDEEDRWKVLNETYLAKGLFYWLNRPSVRVNPFNHKFSGI